MEEKPELVKRFVGPLPQFTKPKPRLVTRSHHFDVGKIAKRKVKTKDVRHLMPRYDLNTNFGAFATINSRLQSSPMIRLNKTRMTKLRKLVK